MQNNKRPVRKYTVKAIHFGPEDADLLPWVESQTNFSAAVKGLIRKELGLTTPPSAMDAEAIRELVERLVSERLAKMQAPKMPETVQEKSHEKVSAPPKREESESPEDEPPPDLFKGLF